MTIKAIKTVYRGMCFDSRLEAKWALFFDLVGVEWEREPEVMRLSDGRFYLPDFVLRGDTLAEVKRLGGDFSKAQQLEVDLREAHDAAVRVLLSLDVPDEAFEAALVAHFDARRDDFDLRVMRLEGNPPGRAENYDHFAPPEYHSVYWAWARDWLVSPEDVKRAAARACSHRFSIEVPS